MKTLHAIKADPTLLEYMALLHPLFSWTIEGNDFAYWFKTDRVPHINRDIRVDDMQQQYQNWLDRGADVNDPWGNR